MGDWEQYVAAPFAVDTLEGERVYGPVMRRRGADGSWTYRKMTPEEEADYVSQEAW